jgi:hypothetical protein
MKKLFIVAALAIATSVGAFAQGFVSSSTLGTSFSISTNGPTSGALASSATAPFGYYFELLVGSATQASDNAIATGWTDSGIEFTNRSSGGLNSISEISVPANIWNAGVSNSFMIVGWSANLGSSWTTVASELQNGVTGAGLAAGSYYGISTIGYGIAGAAAPGTPFHLFGTANASGDPINTPMTLNAVPEPGTVGLAIMGVSSLLMFRRKK